MAATAASTGSSRRSQFASAAHGRYLDAYRVANTVNAFGQGIKIGGCILGFLIFFLVADAMNLASAGFVLGVIVAAVFFVIGILVAALAQVLRATIDTAVHSSPFLTDALRASAMSLKPGRQRSAVGEGSKANGEETQDVTDEPTAPEDEESRPFCYHCGAQVGINDRKCQACGKPL